MKDIVLWKNDYPDIYYKVDKVRKTLDLYFFEYTEYDYKDRYIFSNLRIKKDIVDNFEEIKRGVQDDDMVNE